MALVKWGLPAAVSGKIGGVVALITGIMRIWAKPTNPQTQSQQNQRGILSVLAQAWRGLTEPQRTSWQGLAAEIPQSNRIGDTITLSGNALYNQLNGILALLGTAANATAPVLESESQIIAMTVDADASAHSLTPVVSVGMNNTHDKWIVEATPQLSPGKYFVKNLFRIVVIQDNSDVGLDFGAAYEDMFGTLTVGKKIFIRIRPANNTTGQTGIPFEASTIVVA